MFQIIHAKVIKKIFLTKILLEIIQELKSHLIKGRLVIHVGKTKEEALCKQYLAKIKFQLIKITILDLRILIFIANSKILHLTRKKAT